MQKGTWLSSDKDGLSMAESKQSRSEREQRRNRRIWAKNDDNNNNIYSSPTTLIEYLYELCAVLSTSYASDLI